MTDTSPQNPTSCGCDSHQHAHIAAPDAHTHDHHDTHDHHHDDHDHSHHGHGHGHHHHAPASFGKAFAVGISLNILYILVETVWGLRVHSMSLLADAGHNLSDVLGLASAWFAQILARRAPSNRFTYGMRRATILSALANAVFLLLVTGGIIWESVLRLLAPPAVAGEVVSWVALGGIIINGGTALLFMRGAEDDLNVRGAFLHMASDAVMAFAVVLAGLAIAWTGHTIIDPVVSLLVSLFIVGGTWSLLRGAVTLSLDGVPASIDIGKVETTLRALPGVQDIHHLHVWPMSTTETALTVHILRDADDSTITNAHIMDAARAALRKRFNIGHPTFQMEDIHTSCDPTQHHCQKPE